MAYELNGLGSADANGGSDNPVCFKLQSDRTGHGYRRMSYRPSLQQTASGIYIQLFGGADVNSPSVQAYMEWILNRYRYTDLDSMGNSWPGQSHGYYLWSSFKAMELIRASGIAPDPRQYRSGRLGYARRGRRAGVRGPRSAQGPGVDATAPQLRPGRCRLLRRDLAPRRRSTSTMRTRSWCTSASTAPCRSTAATATSPATAHRAAGKASTSRPTSCWCCSVRWAAPASTPTATAFATRTTTARSAESRPGRS